LGWTGGNHATIKTGGQDGTNRKTSRR